MAGAPRPLRIAFVSPEPRPGGGVPGMAATVALGLAEAGHEVDLWTVPEQRLRLDWAEVPRLRLHLVDSGFRWGRWYSRRQSALQSFVANAALLGSSAVASPRMAREIAAAHQVTPFDVLYRFSTIELLGFARYLHRLPPIVSHPEVHAAGELRYTRLERHLARQCHPALHRWGTEALLAARARRQGRDARRVAHLVAPSQRFAELVAADYGVDRNRVSVVPNPVDLDRFEPAPRTEGGRIRVTYVGRAAVRKGIEQLVELSHRLDDLADQVEIVLVCSTSLWSNYTPLLAGVNRRMTVVLPARPHREIALLLQATDVLLQPSRYEPFALTVAEGLASGCVVVASDEVGAAEGIDPRAVTIVPNGDVRALERAVRDRVAAVLEGRDGPDRAIARAEAERRFDPKTVVNELAEVLARVASTSPTP